MEEHSDRGKKRGDEQQPVSKREQIITLYLSGMRDVEDLAMLTDTRPSYVGSVLQEEELSTGYFDLYTSTQHPMNVYSKFFAGKLGFKDVETAQESVDLIERMHSRFATGRDRAGQHHALVMALTMFNRARWTGKRKEAEVFRQWLMRKFREAAREE